MLVVIPMAGRGVRYKEHSDMPKPLIEIAGKPMVYWAIQSIKDVVYDKIVFIALKEHEEKHNVRNKLSEFVDDFELILIDEVTEGQLCTVLKAKDYFSKDILTMASDVYAEGNISKDIEKESDGVISVAELEGEKWSFTRVENDRVVEVAEKTRISDHVSTGIYYFSDSNDFLMASEEIISKKEKTKGEYYIIPVYNKLIRDNKKIIISKVDKMIDLGTPENKEVFENYIKGI